MLISVVHGCVFPTLMEPTSLHLTFKGADCCGANLEKANLKGASLAGADLKKAKLSGAIMPDGAVHD